MNFFNKGRLIYIVYNLILIDLIYNDFRKIN